MAKKKENPVEGEIVEEKKTETAKKSEIKRSNDGRLFLGVVFLLLGGLIFLNNFYPSIDISSYFWPIILILLGAVMIFRSF